MELNVIVGENYFKIIEPVSMNDATKRKKKVKHVATTWLNILKWFFCHMCNMCISPREKLLGCNPSTLVFLLYQTCCSLKTHSSLHVAEEQF